MDNISYFLRILKNFIWGEESIVLKDMDWENIIKHAHLHQLEAIFYKQTQKKEFQNAFVAQTYFYVNRRKLIDELRSSLKGFEFIFVKGIEIAKYYPYPELRSMGDSDLLVHSNDKAEIHKIFIKLGYSFNDYHEEESKYIKNKMEIEMHDNLLHILEDDETSYSFFNQVWNYVHDGKLDWNFHMIYLLKHMSRHMLSGGIGFRQFMDIAILTQKLTLDWDWIEQELKKINLLVFSKNVFALINIWFDVKSPIEINELNSTFIKEATNLIYECGVFGNTARDKDIISISNKVRNENKPFWFVKMCFILSRLFPSYQDMIQSGFYSYLRKTKYLLPVAWIDRLIKCFTVDNKKKSLKKNLFSSYKKIKQRNDYLSSWGL